MERRDGDDKGGEREEKSEKEAGERRAVIRPAGGEKQKARNKRKGK